MFLKNVCYSTFGKRNAVSWLSSVQSNCGRTCNNSYRFKCFTSGYLFSQSPEHPVASHLEKSAKVLQNTLASIKVGEKFNLHRLEYYMGVVADHGYVDDVLAFSDYLNHRQKQSLRYNGKVTRAYLAADKGKTLIESCIQTSDKPSAAPLILDFMSAYSILSRCPSLTSKVRELGKKYSYHKHCSVSNALWFILFKKEYYEEAKEVFDEQAEQGFHLALMPVSRVLARECCVDTYSGILKGIKDCDYITDAHKEEFCSLFISDIVREKRHIEALEVLKLCIRNGFILKNLQSSIILELKKHIEETGKSFPFEITLLENGKVIVQSLNDS